METTMARAAAPARVAVLGALALLLAAGCDRGDDVGSGMPGMQHSMASAVDTTGLRDLPVPEELHEGRELYRENCAVCHGQAALGTEQGPPLVHIVYEPNHHSDAAFQLAVQRGVRAHHWNFGDMPPVAGVTPDELAEIVAYVRWLQRQAGVY